MTEKPCATAGYGNSAGARKTKITGDVFRVIRKRFAIIGKQTAPVSCFFNAFGGGGDVAQMR